MRALDAGALPHETAVPRVSEAVADGCMAKEGYAARLDTLGERVV